MLTDGNRFRHEGKFDPFAQYCWPNLRCPLDEFRSYRR
jgi:hypothetical protein